MVQTCSQREHGYMDNWVRVSHADRDDAVQRLQDAYADGRIAPGELDGRLETAMSAKTQADLEAAVRDIPSAGVELAARQDMRPARPPGPIDQAGSSDRLLALGTHWLGWVSFFVGPAIVAACAKGTSSRFLRDQAVEALNFQLSVFGAILALGMVTAMTFGIAAIGFPFLLLIWMVLTGVGGLSAAAGNRFRYPWVLRVVKP